MFTFVGVLVGTIIGVLPGLGPTATIILLIPFTLRYPPEAGLVMMAGCWLGANYGGSTTSILVNIPGEPSSVITCIDGYQMTKKGRGGAALALSAGGSFLAGTIGILGLQLVGPLLGGAALAFAPPEYLAFFVLCFIVLSNLTGSSPIKAFIMLGVGLWIGAIGLDQLFSVPRFTFGSSQLMLGLDFLPIAVGLFGITEVFSLAGETYIPKIVKKIRYKDLYPTKEELKRSLSPSIRGSIIGFLIGLVPGPCVVISTFISYAVEKKLSKSPERFGTGMIEGVVGPESANNSAIMGAMIPLLTLGIPFTPTAAVILGGLRMNNLELGPLLFVRAPQIFWTFIASMYVANIMLLILNLPLVGIFARLATVRQMILLPFVCIICLYGTYSIRNEMFDVMIMAIAGLVGVCFQKMNYPVAPLVIGIVLGPMMEYNLRKSLMMFKGDIFLIFNRPIALTFLLLSFAIILFKILYPYFRKKGTVMGESGD